MRNSFLLLVFLSLSHWCIADAKNVLHRSKRASCDPIFSDIIPDHTMCQDDHPNSSEWPLTEEEKQALVDEHNRLRALDAGPGGAKCMQKVVWDENIAVIAEKMARQCIVGHDGNTARRTPALPGVSIGQNGAYGYSDFIAAVQGWHAEIAFFELGVGSTNENETVGHYTQVVYDETARIGCGRAVCTDIPYTNYYYCNYAKGQTSFSTPFCLETDSACTKECTVKDADGLVDCDGKVCVNSGTLNRSTCECVCPSLFTGPTCETVQCSEGSTCPYECSKVCENGGVQNSVPCLCNCPPEWTGELCETPVSGQCSGSCENGGVYNTDLCVCECVDGYTGNTCEIPPTTCTNACENGEHDASCNCQCTDNWAGEACDQCSSDCPEGQVRSPRAEACVCIPDFVDCDRDDSVIGMCQYIASVQTQHNICSARLLYMGYCPNICNTCLIHAPATLPPDGLGYD